MSDLCTVPLKYSIVLFSSLPFVGIRSLSTRFTLSAFSEIYDPLLEDLVNCRCRCIVDDQLCIVNITNTVRYPTSNFEHSLNQYRKEIHEADGFLLVYPVNSRDAFERIPACHKHILGVRGVNTPYPIILVGNKTDLLSERLVSTQEGQELASQLGCKFFETSAKLDINVTEAFHTLLGDIAKCKAAQVAALQVESTAATAHSWSQKSCIIL
ncbi:P-loop containing nucleoside triphosphate hydrolase protein [Abortiporus biennis]|nr:P-loop containing nucleoside triphosphate hydrolase protein [Abortiporus biennis]